MAKTKSRVRKRKPSTVAPTQSTGEQLAAARRQMRQLRELQSLAKQLIRRIDAVSVDLVACARVFVAGTGFTVAEELELSRLAHALTEATEQAANDRKRRAAVEQELNPAAV